ncbi:MAG: guanitoxin biosynthesis pre-guanitoxin forming N-methyltransferase GntF [Candidatus Daviesbacteria bacterium]|nr:guanitoxin biosynthesis pre-guanitoxin forming N-methyltransferase GntF [Candidatus Daviesbacteria bacterium]
MINLETFSEFDTKAYLNEYYSNIGPENHGLLKFFVEAYKEIPDNSLILELGGGPTIYQLITASRKSRSIHFTDYLERNIQEVSMWRRCAEGAFDWSPFVKEALILEGLDNVTHNDIDARGKMMKRKINKFSLCDAFEKDPLGSKYRNHYDLISTNFVVDSITTSKEVWEQLMKNVCSMLRRDGSLILTSLKEAEYYLIGDKKLPAVYLTECDLISALKNLGFQDLFFRSVPAERSHKDKNYQGYNGMCFVRATM